MKPSRFIVILFIACLSILNYIHCFDEANFTLPAYDNCVLIGEDKNVFQWSIRGEMIYGRAIGLGAGENGWTAIGFSSGYAYEEKPVEVDVSGVPKMKGATIYMGYKDPLNNIAINEYFATSYQQPYTIPEDMYKLNISLGRAGLGESGAFHLVFARPLTTTDNYPQYYQFVPGDKSNLLFAKHPTYTPSNPNDFERHSIAELRKIDFFASYRECSSVPPATLILPSYQSVLNITSEEVHIRGEGHPAGGPSLFILLIAFVLAIITTLILP